MMTREEARSALLLYRPGMNDAADPEIAAALALAKQDAELSRWLDQHCAQQEILRAKIRQIPVPAGLKEQIISERPAFTRQRFTRRAVVLALASVSVMLIGYWAAMVWHAAPRDDTFAVYRGRMVSTALRGYSMDLESSDPAKIRAYLDRQKVAENYELPAGLQKAAATGCAIEHWQGAKVALLCFSAGEQGQSQSAGKTDLWLFVVDRDSVKDAPASDTPQFAKVNKLMTATWTRGDKVYLLGTFGDEGAVRRWF
jgi:hypothetical protein